MADMADEDEENGEDEVPALEDIQDMVKEVNIHTKL